MHVALLVPGVGSVAHTNTYIYSALVSRVEAAISKSTVRHYGRMRKVYRKREFFNNIFYTYTHTHNINTHTHKPRTNTHQTRLPSNTRFSRNGLGRARAGSPTATARYFVLPGKLHNREHLAISHFWLTGVNRKTSRKSNDSERA
jgi:hypothetical protein